MMDETYARWKSTFVEEVTNGDHYKVFNSEQYQKLIQEVKDAAIAKPKTKHQGRLLKRFKVYKVTGLPTKLIRPSGENLLYYEPVENLFDEIHKIHLATGHGGRDRIVHQGNKLFANMTKELVQKYLTMCQSCHQKRAKVRRSFVSKPILHDEMNSRCQMDLIDMQSQPDDGYKFILIYQDHLTKFVFLRALQSQTADEVAYYLVDIWTHIGAPCILHTDNGAEFVDKLLDEIVALWPECRVVHGKPRHSQSQGPVERANRDIQNMLACWLKDNQTTKWSRGLKIVQFQKNTALNSGNNGSAYKTMFGMEPRVGLSSTNLPREVLDSMRHESDLEKFIATASVSDPEMDSINFADFAQPALHCHKNSSSPDILVGFDFVGVEMRF